MLEGATTLTVDMEVEKVTLKKLETDARPTHLQKNAPIICFWH